MRVQHKGNKNKRIMGYRPRQLQPTVLLAMTLWLAFGMIEASAQQFLGSTGILKPTSGPATEVQLLAITDDGRLRIGGKSPQELVADQVWRFGADRGQIRGPIMLLRDGSRYSAPAVTTTGADFIFTTDEIHPGLWDGWRISISDVSALSFRPPHGMGALAEIIALAQPVAADTLLLDNGDELQGEFRGIETVAGTLADEIQFAVRDRVSRIAVAKAVSLRLAEREKSPLSRSAEAWTLAFDDGSRVYAREVVANAKSVRWKSDRGQAREVNAEEFWKQLTLVEPPRRDVTFVSELKEQGYRHLPMFGEAARWGANRSANGTPLRHQGAYYAKGIGMWSNSRLSFAIPKDATQFVAEAGVDDAAGDGGSVIFRVLAQYPSAKGAELKELYKSETLRGGETSRNISVSIEGAASLILLVEAADQGDALDLADWLDARFVIPAKAP